MIRHPVLPSLALFLALAGCANTATLHVWQPAQIDTTGIERLAVLDFRGPHESGQIARSTLVSQLWQDGFYTLVDQSELEGVRPASASGPAGSPDVGPAVAAARAAGVDALLVGDVVSYHAADDVTTDQRFGFFNSDERQGPAAGSVMGVGFENNETVNREITASLAFQLIDARTGRILAARQSSYTEKGQLRNGEGHLPAREATLAKCMHRCARDIVDMLTPRQIPMRVELATATFGRAAGEIRRGNARAAKGDWQAAEAHWRAALELDPDNHAAMYNLGLACEARFDYGRAEELYADALNGKQRGLYARALERLRGEREDYLLATSQRDRRGSPGPYPSEVLASPHQPLVGTPGTRAY